MQVPNFCWAIDICQFDAHLAYQEAVIFIIPFYTITIYIIGLFWKNRIILGSDGTGVLLFLPNYLKIFLSNWQAGISVNASFNLFVP